MSQKIGLQETSAGICLVPWETFDISVKRVCPYREDGTCIFFFNTVQLHTTNLFCAPVCVVRMKDLNFCQSTFIV